MSKRKSASREARLKATAAQNAPAATDSYSNIPARIGSFTGNLESQGSYPLTRLTQDYMRLLAMYRNHWIVRKIVDVVAEDMLKHAPTLNCELNPKLISKFDKVLRDTGTMAKMLHACQMGRLFGGAVAVICIEGHDDLSLPLELDDVDLGSYKGLIVLDRWSGVFPDSELVSDLSYPKAFGLPKYYECRLGNQNTVKVHHTRVLRFTGRPLPEWERQVEMYWGLSEIEVVFDELQKRDYTSWNIVSLVTRAQILGVKDEQLAQKMTGMAMSQDAFNQYLSRMDAMSQSMNNQGLLVVGKDGGIEQTTFSFGGLADIQENQMADIAGAAEIHQSRLYGRIISGLGSTGDGELQIHDDMITTKRSREINPLMDDLLPIICMSTFGRVPDDFDYGFPPLRTMTNKDRSDLAKTNSDAIGSLYERDLLTKKEARGELKKSADENGLGETITDEALEDTPDTYASESGGGELELGGDDETPALPEPRERKRLPAATDSAIPSIVAVPVLPDGSSPVTGVEAMLKHNGLLVAIENMQGSVRRGLFWKTRMPADYGYIVGVTGADGDELDCYLGRSPESDRVFVVDQNQFDGKTFDEHKVMLAYRTADEALADYMAGHHKSKRVFGAMTEMSMPQFKDWMRNGDLTSRCEPHGSPAVMSSEG